MAVKDNNDNFEDSSKWAGTGAEPKQGPSTFGLVNLFNQASMVSNNRNMKEAVEVAKDVVEFYKTMETSTTSADQRKIIPTVENLTSSISPLLPGLCFHREVEGTGYLYVMGVLFAKRDLCVLNEKVYAFQNNVRQSISIPVAPADYADKRVIDALTKHYSATAKQRGLRGVIIVNMRVVDLDMYTHKEIVDAEDRVSRIVNGLTADWEEAILTRAAEDAAKEGIVINPFVNGQPYGEHKTAEARITAVSNRLDNSGMLSPSNMEIIATTANPNIADNQQTAKEIARVRSTVSLSGVSMGDYMRDVQAGGSGAQDYFRAMTMMQGVYPNGYRPLRPIITLDEAVAGEQMHYNGGLYPFFMGLYLNMCSNTRYAFAESLRRTNPAGRGNLSDLETRIDSILEASGISPKIANRIILTEKNMGDTDVVNQWIQQNVSPNAVFQSKIVQRGNHSAINNFLTNLAFGKEEAITTAINVMDGLSNGNWSKVLKEEAKKENGWTPNKPWLHRTSQIAPNGICSVGDKQFNTLEMDEMQIAHLKGNSANAKAGISDLLRIIYGSAQQNEDMKARAQRLRVQMTESLYDGACHINGYGTVCIWDPTLNALWAKAMDMAGGLSLIASNFYAQNRNISFAPGIGLATYASAGGANPMGNGTGNFSISVPFA